MYFIQRTEEFDNWLAKLKDLRAKGKVLLLVLCGGTKNTQQRDIERAKSLTRKYEDILDEWS